MTNANGPHRSVEGVLSALRLRSRGMHALSDALRGLVYGSISTVVIAGMRIALGAGWMHNSPWRVLSCIPIFALVAALVGALRRIDDLPLARALDRAAAGEDRFASALQLGEHHRRSRAQLIVEDA